VESIVDGDGDVIVGCDACMCGDCWSLTSRGFLLATILSSFFSTAFFYGYGRMGYV
jgi:hypothetical protein